VNELERIEAQAMRDAVVLAGGQAVTTGGALCFSYEHAPVTELNRAIPLGPHVDVGAVADWFGGRAHAVAVPPGYVGLEEMLAAHGYEPGYAWMKFTRDGGPPAAAATDLRVEESLDAEAFALAVAEGFGLPDRPARGLAAIVGTPGWHCFVAWDGDEPAAGGALYADGGEAWVGIAATRPAFRRRGAQGAILAARVSCARELGARRISTETGERVAGRPDQSYRNILRAGFREAYLRPNWRSRAARSTS
jgi:GNAT superfamily N-acetyltransferase